jgi:hypothetical protein
MQPQQLNIQQFNAVGPTPTVPSGGPGERPPSHDPLRHWPEGAAEQARVLHRQLAISDREWHALKSQRARRGAEQLAAALVHLLSADDPRQNRTGPARQEATALVEHALAWLRAEISDPGCPSHGR